MRKKGQYVYASYQLGSTKFSDVLLGKKDYWVFCSSGCKTKGDSVWLAGNFGKDHGKKKINFKP
jgi:hypothetical protein